MSTGAARGVGRFVNGESVYGTILTAGVVSGLSHWIADPAELLATAIGTVIRLGRPGGRDDPAEEPWALSAAPEPPGQVRRAAGAR
ncbi:hypothetical protein [Nonomuraea sp. NPDC049646]|uniref:hypothetical protein n=1 Tax=unclassified Nonomuraea TaxID=2593643 RepID=UPI0037B43645